MNAAGTNDKPNAKHDDVSTRATEEGAQPDVRNNDASTRALKEKTATGEKPNMKNLRDGKTFGNENHLDEAKHREEQPNISGGVLPLSCMARYKYLQRRMKV